MNYSEGASGIAVSSDKNLLYFDVADGTSQARKMINSPINNIAPVGKWSFIVLTNSGVEEAGGLKLYKNSAILVGNTTGAETVRWSENYTLLGWGQRDHFKGLIAEVRIYDRALDTTEIEALYSGQDVTGSLRGYWKLDETSGNTAHDSSGNGNNGLRKGPVWYVGGDIVDETGSFGTGAYSLDITGLKSNTYYRIRAFAENALGTGYGDVVTCKTPA